MMALVLGIYTSSLTVGTSIGNYSDMSAQGRIAMSLFERDLRSASSLTVATNTRVEFSMVSSVDVATGVANFVQVAYYYDSAKKELCREFPIGGAKTIVLRDLTDCRFAYFNGNDTILVPATPNPAVNAKKVVIYAAMLRGRLGKVNTDNLVSAVVVLRSK